MYTESNEMKHKSSADNEQLLKQACIYLESSFNDLSELGYKCESIEMMFLHVEIQKKIALAQDDNHAKKRLLLETLDMARSAVKNVTLVAAEITDLSPREEVGNMFLPIQHDVISAGLHCIKVMYEIVKLALEEKKIKRLEEESKKAIVRVGAE